MNQNNFQKISNYPQVVSN